MAKIIDGAAMARSIKDDIIYWANVNPKWEARPRLDIVCTSDDPASVVYVNHKLKDCAECRIRAVAHRMQNATTKDVLGLIDSLNANPEVDGIIVQLPGGHGLCADGILEHISFGKDVDGLCPRNLGKLMAARNESEVAFVPCTPKGVIHMLTHLDGNEKASDEHIRETRSVVIGRSNIVGKPIARMLEMLNSTVTVCHSGTPSIADYTKHADIVVSATGVPGMVTGDMIKSGAIVVDVGITRRDDGKLVGDVDCASVETVAGYITPVPGGVGPMTRAMLLKNMCIAAELRWSAAGKAIQFV